MNIEELLKGIPKENHEHFINCLEVFKKFYIKSLNELDFMKDFLSKNGYKISNITFLPWHEGAQNIFSLAHNFSYYLAYNKFSSRPNEYLSQLTNLDHLQVAIKNSNHPTMEPSIYLKPKIKINGKFNSLLTIQLFECWSGVLKFNICFDHLYNLLSKPDQKIIYDTVAFRLTRSVKGVDNPPETFKELFLFL